MYNTKYEKPWWENVNFIKWDPMGSSEEHFEAAFIMDSIKSALVNYSIRKDGIITNKNRKSLLKELEDLTFLRKFKTIYSPKTLKESVAYYCGISCFVKVSYSKDRISFTAYSTNEKQFNEIVSKFKYIEDEYTKTKGTIYTPISTREGLVFKRVGSGGRRLVRKNYLQKTLDDFDYVTSQLQKEIPDGRLLILQGPPGTGKSYFIRGILNEIYNAIFVVISPDQVSHLMDPSFIPSLLDLKEQSSTSTWDPEIEDYVVSEKTSITLIIEDADSILVPRGSDNMTAVSVLLNFADGIIGESLDIRIVTSTNANLDKFDSALTRPGRLLKVMTLDRLPQWKAQEIFDRLSDSGTALPAKEYTLAEVYNLAKNGEPGEIQSTKNKVGFA